MNKIIYTVNPIITGVAIEVIPYIYFKKKPVFHNVNVFIVHKNGFTWSCWNVLPLSLLLTITDKKEEVWRGIPVIHPRISPTWTSLLAGGSSQGHLTQCIDWRNVHLVVLAVSAGNRLHLYFFLMSLFWLLSIIS